MARTARKSILAATAALALLLAPLATAQDALRVEVAFDGLAPPPYGHYEGWVVTADGPASTGKFLVADDGALTDLDGAPVEAFYVDGVLASDVTRFVLSLEPEGDDDAVPAAVKPLAGDVADGRAELEADLGVPFGDASGTYILATPTDGPGTNEEAGIWFLVPDATGHSASLDLPDLTGTDWVYEGWVVLDGVPVATGRFDHPDQADDADPHSGDLDAPPFPGEDLLRDAPDGLTFPADLRGAVAVVSIEPRDDPDPAPFLFKPLVGNVPADAQAATSYALEAVPLASGTVVLGHEDAMEKDGDAMDGAMDKDGDAMDAMDKDGAMDGEDVPGPGVLVLLAAVGAALVLARRRNR